ncbi:MAG: c-type cytochrome [Sulfuricellaceae bacterium]|nr:c-type cytochrome [Sulfuricellaceae bacterium]
MTPFNIKTIAAMIGFASGIVLIDAAQAADDAAKAATTATEVCAGCHGADGNSIAPNFPKLAGQQKVYLLRELKDYKSGKRVSEIMAPLMATLSDDDLPHLAAYYAKQKPAPGVAGDAKLLTVGKNLYLKGNSKTDVPSCDSCHEEDGNGSGKFPRVAGQHVDYTLDQFRLYATGKRTNGARVMQAVAERMSEEETRAVAEFMASMP